MADSSGSVLEIRPAVASDLAVVAGIERATFSDPWSQASFRSLLRNELAVFLVAEQDRRVVGYAVLVSALNEAEVANLAVRSEDRGRGIGARLLDAALRDARARGTTVVFLEVRDSNAAARALYGSRGFHEIARRRRYYRHPTEDAIVMRCSIGVQG